MYLKIINNFLKIIKQIIEKFYFWKTNSRIRLYQENG